jgi:prepilin-type N-terminal cleavage/methylation domain-containing protein
MNRPHRQGGFTLTEIMMVLGLLVLIGGAGVAGFNSWRTYRDQLQAESALNTVAGAQRAYLIENPTASYSDLTQALLTPFLPGQSMPSLPSGTTLNVAVFPPTATRGTTVWRARDY